MIHQQSTGLLAYEHYFVYLHLCIADSDCVIKESEFDTIRKVVFPSIDKDRADKVVKQVYMEFLSHNDFEKKETIRNLSPKFLRTNSIREKVLASLTCITNKEEGCEELTMFRYIDSVLGSKE